MARLPARARGSLLLMTGYLVAFVAAGLALRGTPRWRGYWVYSVLNAPLAVLVAVVLWWKKPDRDELFPLRPKAELAEPKPLVGTEYRRTT